VFVVVATGNAPKVLAAIQAKNYAYYTVKSDVWLVAFDGTTRELAESTGIRSGESGPGLTCLITGYSGRLPKEAWEWLGVHEVRSE